MLENFHATHEIRALATRNHSNTADTNGGQWTRTNECEASLAPGRGIGFYVTDLDLAVIVTDWAYLVLRSLCVLQNVDTPCGNSSCGRGRDPN